MSDDSYTNLSSSKLLNSDDELEFMKARMSLSGESSTILSEQEIELYKQAFDDFDEDKDGAISTVELANAFRRAGHNPTEGEIQDMINETDTNNSGQIEFDEFIDLVKKKLKEREDEQDFKETFRVFSKDDQGCVTMEEMKFVLCHICSPEEAKQMIQPMDDLTDRELEVVTAVFRSFETGLREATIYPKDLHPAMKMLGLNPMEQEIIDLTNEIAKNGFIYFPEFCTVVTRKLREEDEEVFRQNMFKVSEQDIEEMFDYADSNKDGKISYQEFQTMINPPKPPEPPKPNIKDLETSLSFHQLNPDGQPCLTEDLKGQQPGGGVQQQQEQVQGQPPQQRRQSQHHIHNNKGHNNHQQQFSQDPELHHPATNHQHMSTNQPHLSVNQQIIDTQHLPKTRKLPSTANHLPPGGGIRQPGGGILVGVHHNQQQYPHHNNHQNLPPLPQHNNLPAMHNNHNNIPLPQQHQTLSVSNFMSPNTGKTYNH